jgi:DNA polymerase-3 subunit alpha
VNDFCHLHLHSEGSLLDGYSKVDDIARIAKELGQSSVCLTDHGSLAQAIKFNKAGLEYEIKTIQGWEAYVSPRLAMRDKDTPIWHFIMLAMNQDGLKNLFALSRLAWTEGFYRKPRIDYTALDQYSDNIIVTSACMGGEIARAIESNDSDGALESARRYHSIFGDRFYIELQPGNTAELNHKLAQLADDIGCKSVVAIDAHHDQQENKAIQELLLLIQQIPGFKQSEKTRAQDLFQQSRKQPSLLEKLNILWPDRGLRFDQHELYIMSRQEVIKRMDQQGFDGNELANNTLEIAERCTPTHWNTKANYLPSKLKIDSDLYLRELCLDGLETMGLAHESVYKARLEHELGVIKEKQFADYFILVWDIVNIATRGDVYVGPGRGSAAGSLVSFCLGITKIDPIKYKLLFARFLDPERYDMPDIDLDIEHTKRDWLKDQLKNRYGHVAGISTYTSFHGKSLVRSISRALMIPLEEVNAVCKQFNTLEEYLESDQCEGFRNKYPEISIAAQKLESHITASGAHAAGLLVADRPLETIVPMETRTDPKNKKQRIEVCAFDMWDVAEAQLIKIDLLGLNNLSVIHDCINMIKRRHNVTIDPYNIATDDSYVLEQLSQGHTLGVFQMESGVYRKLLKEIQVDSFNDLVASNALVRPGAYLTAAKPYIARKKGLEAVQYPHEVVAEILSDTYGLPIFQEQVMQMAVALGGFSWAEANKLRKIIGKKKDAAEFKPYYQKWLSGATKFISAADADKIWHDFEKHAGYSFNISHSVAYSYVGWITAYLKFRYPLEYMFALLRNERNESTRMSYLMEAMRLGIELRAPDVLKSQIDINIEQDALRFGLCDIKGVGIEAAQEIINNRPFWDYEEFEQALSRRKVNAKVKSALLAVDAFISLRHAPRNVDAQNNYLEYLAFPIDLQNISDELQVVSMQDHQEQDVSLLLGVVKNIKRTATYVRIELEDMTGTVTCFARMNNDLSTGEMVLALVGDKALLAHARVAGLQKRIQNNTATPIEKLLLNPKMVFSEFTLLTKLFGIDTLNDMKSLALPVYYREFTTKTDKKMAWCYLADSKLNIKKITMFPQQWAKHKDKIMGKEILCVQLQLAQDGKSWTPELIDYAQDVAKFKGL